MAVHRVRIFSNASRLLLICLHFQASEVEETLKRIQSHKGVIGTIIVNSEGWFTSSGFLSPLPLRPLTPLNSRVREKLSISISFSVIRGSIYQCFDCRPLYTGVSVWRVVSRFYTYVSSYRNAVHNGPIPSCQFLFYTYRLITYIRFIFHLSAFTV